MAREYCPNKEEIVINPVPQVGFQKNDNTYEYFELAEIPGKKDIEGKYQQGLFIYPEEATPRIIELLKEKGYEPNNLEGKDIHFEGTILYEVMGTVDIRIQRALAKIGFNYLTYRTQHNLDIIFHEQFHPIRSFILNGQKPAFPYFNVSKNHIIPDTSDGTALLAHFIVIEENSHDITIKISLFNQLTYVITLVKNYQIMCFKEGFGHAFSLGDRKIYQLSKYPLLHPSTTSLIIPPSPLILAVTNTLFSFKELLNKGI